MSELVTVYRDYVACLNDRRWPDLGRYVADDVVHNDRELGLAGYRAMLEADVQAIPDLRFVPQILVADDRFVSCRLAFDCTPQHPFCGFEATGRRVSFAENVFYRFDGAKIAHVWSVIDRDAIALQGFQRSVDS